MVDTQCGDAGDNWLGDNVGGVVPTTNTDFEDGGVDLLCVRSPITSVPVIVGAPSVAGMCEKPSG